MVRTHTLATLLVALTVSLTASFASPATPAAPARAACAAPRFSGAPTSPSVVADTLAAGDFDRDGRTDIAVGAERTPGIALLLNHAPAGGDLAFSAPISLTVATEYPAWQIAALDLNADGWADLAFQTADGPGQAPAMVLLVSRGTAQGGAPLFAQPLVIPLADQWQPLAAGDVNADGLPDILVGEQLLMNTSTPGAPLVSMASSTLTISIAGPSALADVDGDGRSDLVADAGGGLLIYRSITAAGASATTFLPPAAATTGLASSGVGVALLPADVDGDGRQDLVWMRESRTSRDTLIALNRTPAGGQPDLAFSFGATGVAADFAADLNGDGRDELLVFDPDAFTVSSAQADPSLPLVQRSYFSDARVMAGAAADFNGDGVLDIVQAGESPAGLRLLTNRAPPGAAEPFFGLRAGLAGFPGWDIVAADLNGDGRADLTSSAPAGARVRLAVAGQPAAPLAYGAPQDVALADRVDLSASADLDGDGDTDLVGVALSGGMPPYVAVLVVNDTPAGAGSLTLRSVTLPGGLGRGFLVPGDLDGDGLPELIGGTADSLVAWRNVTAPGAGGPAFDGPFALAGSPDEGEPRVIDVNSDGRPDVVYTPNHGVLSWAMNQTQAGGALSFAPATAIVDPNPFLMGSGDIDGDGRTDLAVMSMSFPGPITLLLNRTAPGATTAAFESVPATERSWFAALGDVDGDGRADLLAGWDTGLQVLRSTPSGGSGVTLAPALIDPSIWGASYSYALADVDRDGFDDIIAFDPYGGEAGITHNRTVQSLELVSGDAQIAAAGAAFAQPLTVRVTDACGGAVAGARVLFAQSDGPGGVQLGAAEAVTDSDGRASVSVTGGQAGAAGVVASAGLGGPSRRFALEVGAAAPTATPTETATATPSATATETDTATATPSETATATSTATATATPSATPAASETATATVTPSATATSTPTSTSIPAASETATATATPSGTPAASETATATAAAPATATATATGAPAATATPQGAGRAVLPLVVR